MPDKSDPLLTLRVSIDPPKAEVSATAGKRLEGAGFKVESVSPRGLLITGARSLIEQFFNSRIDIVGTMLQFKDVPGFDRLPGGASYRVYFPRTPTYFS
jgi:hypothetical protein